MERKKDIEKLYRDAAYFHLLYEGYTIPQAEFKVKRLFDIE